MGPLMIRAHKLGKGSVKVGVHSAVKGGVVAIQGMFLNVFPEFFLGAGVFPLQHPEEGDYGHVKLLNFVCQSRPEGITLLPVTALNRIHVLGCGIPEVYGKAFNLCFLFYLLQDRGLFFGEVCLGGFVVLFPKCSKGVTVRHCSGIYCSGPSEGKKQG